MGYLDIGIAFLCLLVIYQGVSWCLPDRICTIQKPAAPGFRSERRKV